MKGYALLIGVNTLDQTHYAGDRYFADAFDDIPVICDILKDIGIFHPDDIHVHIDLEKKPDDGAPAFNIDILTTNPVLKPTAHNFLKSIREFYIEQSDSEEGFLVLFFTGHGTFVEVEIENEEGKMEMQKRQFLCFQDRMLLENEMRETLTKIPKNIKVFFVVNACYSGGLSQAKFNLINWKHIFDSHLPTLETAHENGNKDLLADLQELGTLLFSNENLVVNHYVVDLIARSKVIEDTLRNHCNYIGKIERFSNNYMDYETEFCYLFSCDKDQITKIGWLDKPSYFVGLLNEIWNDHKNDSLTYKDFTEKLKARAAPLIQPKLDLFPEGGKTIFETAYPFHYERKTESNNSQIKSTIMATLLLTPFPNATPTYVKVDINGGLFSMDATKSTTYDLTIDSNPRLSAILALISKPDLKDIRYLGVIDVQEVTTPSGHFPAKIPNMEIDDWRVDDNTEDGNGLVVLYDGTAIKGKKRTNGKVTNSQD